jgi:hypothetical protein
MLRIGYRGVIVLSTNDENCVFSRINSSTQSIHRNTIVEYLSIPLERGNVTRPQKAAWKYSVSLALQVIKLFRTA